MIIIDLNCYKIEGKFHKIPIFMIHTIPYDGTYIFNSLKNVESPNDIYIIDLPSHGKSYDISPDEMKFSKFADKIYEFQRELGIKEIFLYGHGIGGFVVLHYALKYQKFLKGIILSSSAISGNYRRQLAWNIRSKFSDTKNDQIGRGLNIQEERSISKKIEDSLPAYFYINPTQMKDKLISCVVRLATIAYVHLSHKEISVYNLKNESRKIMTPALILGGAYDVWPIEEVKQLDSLLKNSKMYFFKSGHFPMMEIPKKYWQIILTWINEK